MKIMELEKDILLYQFEEEEKTILGYNIVALLHDDEAWLLDTGYEAQGEEVMKELAGRGIQVTGALISHFHHDHIFGLKVLPKIEKWGSSEYPVTFSRYFDEEEQGIFRPDRSVTVPTEISFGRHRLRLIPSPGHSCCGMWVDIQGKYLQIGDEILLTNDGQPVLPSVNRKEVMQHRDALGRLKKYPERVWIPSHGMLLKARRQQEREVENRQAYLGAVGQAEEPISFEEAVKECNIQFLQCHWHENLYR